MRLYYNQISNRWAQSAPTDSVRPNGNLDSQSNAILFRQNGMVHGAPARAVRIATRTTRKSMDNRPTVSPASANRNEQQMHHSVWSPSPTENNPHFQHPQH
ncbi:MAG: hypothetical protein K5882_11635 [Bacteroidales bacterium]|nr:hypothetical protein [Bacteroidales bacterium]